MLSRPYYDFRDVIAAPARALSAKQIFVMTLFLCLSLIVYNIFTYLSYIVDGQGISVVYRAYGLLPFGLPSLAHGASFIVYGVGLALTVLVGMLGFFAVSAINIEQMRGNRFMSWRQATRFAFKRFGQIFLSELAVVAFVAFIIFLLFLFGLVTRIPAVGDWLYTILFALPNFIIALFTVFIIFVLALSVILLPAVAAAERHGESFGVIVETFSTIIRQPFRWAGYTVYSAVAAKICSFIYAYFTFRAVQFLVWSSKLGGGERLEQITKAGLSHLPVNSDIVRETFNIFPGIDWHFSLGFISMGGRHDAVSYLMAVMIFLIFASIIGYAFAIVAAGQAYGFAAIRKIKDDYDIAAEDSLFFTEEHVNPEIGETGKDEDAD
jgi:hypothetical protein